MRHVKDFFLNSVVSMAQHGPKPKANLGETSIVINLTCSLPYVRGTDGFRIAGRRATRKKPKNKQTAAGPLAVVVAAPGDVVDCTCLVRLVAGSFWFRVYLT